MNTPMLLKIRVLAVLILTIVVFSMIGYSMVRPLDPLAPLTLAHHHQAVRLAVVAFILGILTTLAALAIGGRWARHIAPIAVPIGLTAWSVMSGPVHNLLLQYPQVADRSAMYWSLAIEGLFWFVLIVVGFLFSNFAARMLFYSAAAPEKPQGPETVPGHKHFREKLPPGGWLRGLGALAICIVLAQILINLFTQSGSVLLNNGAGSGFAAAGVPAQGQVIFAVGTSFFLAVLAAEQLFDVPVWVFLPAPLLVSAFVYFSGASDAALTPLAGLQPGFVAAAHRTALILPIQFLGVGSLALFAGYWFSIRARRIRFHTARAEAAHA